MTNEEAHSAVDSAGDLDGVFKAELERRLGELDRLPDSAFGEFTPLDWAASAILFLLVPLLLVWLFR